MLQYHPTDGGMGMGSLPLPFTPLLESIQFQYATRILPTMEQSAHHIHLTNITLPDLQESIDSLLCQPFWRELCPYDSNGSSCRVTPMIEMNTLYFRHLGYAKQRRYLYGTTTNTEEHTDTVFRFPHIRLYRVLIGLSDGNNSTETYFPVWNKGTFLNRRDYIVYDVDRTRHVMRHQQPITTSCSLPPCPLPPCPLPPCPPLPRPHFFLSLHFLIYDPSVYSLTTIHYLSRLYVYYDHITRWLITMGTDPVTYPEYVMGWVIQLYRVSHVAHTMVGVTFITFLILRYTSYSMTTSFFYSFLAPLVSLLLLALEDWIRGVPYKVHDT